MIQSLLVQTSSGICVAHDPEAFSSRTQWTIYLSSIGIWPNICCWSGTRGVGPSTQWYLCWSWSRAFHPSTQWASYLCSNGIWPKFAVGQEPEGLLQVHTAVLFQIFYHWDVTKHLLLVMMQMLLVQTPSGICVGLDPDALIQAPSGHCSCCWSGTKGFWSKHPVRFVFF